MSADAFEDIAQVSEGVETQPFGGGDQAGQHGGGPATVVAAIERPIAATDSDATQAALGPGMPTSGLCRAISPPTDSERVSAALIVADAA
jgi:hypothetical protein